MSIIEQKKQSMREIALAEANEAKQKTATKTAPAVTEAAKPEKKAAGRPASKRPSKQVPFHLPIDLLDRIDAAAEESFGGNKSKLVTRAIEKLLAELEAK